MVEIGLSGDTALGTSNNRGSLLFNAFFGQSNSVSADSEEDEDEYGGERDKGEAGPG